MAETLLDLRTAAGRIWFASEVARKMINDGLWPGTLSEDYEGPGWECINIDMAVPQPTKEPAEVIERYVEPCAEQIRKAIVSGGLDEFFIPGDSAPNAAIVHSREHGIALQVALQHVVDAQPSEQISVTIYGRNSAKAQA
jgi:hypothetical protein